MRRTACAARRDYDADVPSPIGHALGASRWRGPSRRPTCRATTAGGRPSSSRRSRWRRDLDLLIGRHSAETHSLGAALIVAAIAAWQRWPVARRRWRIGLAVFPRLGVAPAARYLGPGRHAAAWRDGVLAVQPRVRADGHRRLHAASRDAGGSTNLSCTTSRPRSRAPIAAATRALRPPDHRSSGRERPLRTWLTSDSSVVDFGPRPCAPLTSCHRRYRSAPHPYSWLHRMRPS